MEEQDEPIASPSDGVSSEESASRGEETRVGQIVHSPATVTRSLPVAPTPRRVLAQTANAALRERIATLSIALGDPTHPLHHQAMDDMVAIGEPAVPALNEALNPHRPWLAAYRAAEALGQIGDGRAAGPLLEALRHPNSNVRWSAVRALAVVGDARALFDLRRVAREDHSKTSWGESVAGAAQSVLDQMQSHNMILRGVDLIKTAVACVVMLVALILAWSVITSLRSELKQLGQVPVDAGVVAPAVQTPLPTEAPLDAGAGIDEPTVGPALPATAVISGTVLTTGNVRAQASRQGERVGGVSEGDQIIFVATTPDHLWYRVKLGDQHASGSQISSLDGTGWVSSSLLSKPSGDVAVEQAELSPTASP
jgi:hypothetical protein